MHITELFNSYNLTKICSMGKIDTNKIIGKNLRRIRLLKKMTQDDLAEIINTSKPQISAIENGKKGLGKELQEKICTKLNIKLYEFYIENETPIIIDAEEMKVIAAMRNTPESKPVLVKISEAYTNTAMGDKTEDENSTIPAEGDKRKKQGTA